MASWIVHLRIAELLLERIPGLNAGKFAVGSIAPDSGVPDEKWENFTPPPWVTHFGQTTGADHRLADLEFYRRYLLSLKPAPDPGLISFRLGYFFHLITDNLWSEKVGIPTTQRFSVEFAADKDFIWEVKKDWYGLDFIHLRDHLDCLFWRVFLTVQPETDGLDFLPQEGLLQRVKYIQQYYQRTDEKVQGLYNRPYIYLSQAEADRFVVESSTLIFRIYQYLQADQTALDDINSSLDLPIDMRSSK